MGEKWWIFTFGCGQEHAGHYVRFYGTYGAARQQMFDKYGDKWAFQYAEEEFDGNETELKEDEDVKLAITANRPRPEGSG